MKEGRGFLIRTGVDTPWTGWLGAQALTLSPSDPWQALEALAEICRVFPGGWSLVWDGPDTWLDGLIRETQVAFLRVLTRLPGLTLHLSDQAWVEGFEGAPSLWIHSPEPPTGAVGQVWRQGGCGWVPAVKGAWALPGLGTAPAETGGVTPSAAWGQVVLPVGALGTLDADELVVALANLQGTLEQGMSQRVGLGAWPPHFPFQRRRTGWNLALLGGREYASAGGVWEEAAQALQALTTTLEAHLRCPIRVCVCDDLASAAALGHQAMREGLPWRNTLPLPPASPVFACGLATDPREPSPLASRAFVPLPMGPVLSHPPIALLRVPTVPGEASVQAFLRGLPALPALRWIPGSMPPPGPFLADRPWPQASAFPPVTDVTQAQQPTLFGALDLE